MWSLKSNISFCLDKKLCTRILFNNEKYFFTISKYANFGWRLISNHVDIKWKLLDFSQKIDLSPSQEITINPLSETSYLQVIFGSRSFRLRIFTAQPIHTSKIYNFQLKFLIFVIVLNNYFLRHIFKEYKKITNRLFTYYR